MSNPSLKSEISGLVEEKVETKCKLLIVAFTSDWLFPSSESLAIVKALNRTAADVSFVEIDSDKGHDSFLLEIKDFYKILHGFISGAARKKGI